VNASDEAAEGIRTLDLLHGKQWLIARQGSLLPLSDWLRGESSGESRLRDSPPFTGSFRTQSGLNPDSRLRPPDQQPMRIVARANELRVAKPVRERPARSSRGRQVDVIRGAAADLEGPRVAEPADS
jgi:hypothetical protein